jgi:hypothetical protein
MVVLHDLVIEYILTFRGTHALQGCSGRGVVFVYDDPPTQSPFLT